MSDIAIILSVIFTGGGFYFMTNHRLKALETKIEKQADLKESIARLDERLALLINHFIKSKNNV